MARPLRIEYPGAWYHVMNRGASRRAIFSDDNQRDYFLGLLAETAERFNADWHAYCLMTNHYHLLLHTPDGNLQRIMRHLNGVYTQYYNRAMNRDGPLFRGRYKAVLVDAPAYWSQLSRYIHRNPLEAGMVKRLADYPWSSYPAYIGSAPRPQWLTCDYVLKTIARRSRRARYRAYVESGGGEESAAFYANQRHGPILGDADFKRRLQLRSEDIDVPELRAARYTPDAEDIAQAVARHLKVDPGAIWTLKRGRQAANPARGMTMYLCQHIGDMKLAEIAERFGLRHYASASSSIRVFRERLGDNQRMQKIIKAIKLDLTL